jgi:ubiquitin carboxyl-terminal hydrolase 25
MVASDPGSRPGKTAPKLFQDFLIFDPIFGVPNVLKDFTPPQGEGPQLAARLEGCKHEYSVKPEQSLLPPLDLRDHGRSVFRAAVLCKRCRIHSSVQVDTSRGPKPCPTSDHQLHHFQFLDQETSAERIIYTWQCSVEECQARLAIDYRKPRINDADIALLTNPALLKRRYEDLLREDPERKDVREATPLQPLNRIRTYVRDSLSGKHAMLKAHNKRFQEACGIQGLDCREFLQKLGFQYVVGHAVLSLNQSRP